MKLAEVEYTSGHKLIDNGVGDYDLICPARGNMGFATMSAVMLFPASSCSGCGRMIGTPKPGQPEPYAMASP